jgi:hypothetical protein
MDQLPEISQGIVLNELPAKKKKKKGKKAKKPATPEVAEID